MHYNFKHGQNRPIYHLNSFNLSIQRLFFHFSLFIQENLRTLCRSLRSAFQCLFRGSKLSRQIFLVLMVVTFHPFPGHALTSTTSNVIYGNSPFLTLDAGRTRIVNADGLLGISLSNGVKYTPSINNSSTTPIELPVVGQSFADISMFVPTNTYSITLSTLIKPPYNYWGDDDGDDDITAAGNISLSIFDKNNNPISRKTVLTICNAPYKVELSNTDGTLATNYGVPRSRNFNASNVTYYITPKGTPEICLVTPNLRNGTNKYAGPASLWDPKKGFFTRTARVNAINFPTTGANNLSFKLNIEGSSEVLSWAPVSHSGITATISGLSIDEAVVRLTGPVATSSQWNSDNPGRIAKPVLPQEFKLVARDSRGNEVAKYEFTLRKWFVNRGTDNYSYSNTVSWCNSLGYRIPLVRDLTNAVRSDVIVASASPPSSGDYYQRRVAAGFFSEWGMMSYYTGANFSNNFYWTSDVYDSANVSVYAAQGSLTLLPARDGNEIKGLCISD